MNLRRIRHEAETAAAVGGAGVRHLSASISAAQTPPPCPTSAPDGFHKGTSCAITIDRENPASPATLVVRAGTSVTIVLKRARANESVAFTPTTTQTPPIDVAATFLKAAIPTLQSSGIHQDNYRALNQIPSSPWLPKDDPLLTELNELIDDMVKTLRTMADASVQLSCLEAYRDLERRRWQLFLCGHEPHTFIWTWLPRASSRRP